MIDKRRNDSNARQNRSESADSRNQSGIEFDAILEAFSNECRAGKTPSIKAYIKKYPQHKADIKSLFPSVQWMEQLKDAEQDERAEISQTAGSSQNSQTVDDYKIVREIGRGGMGVVYEAYQKTLQRRVALKLLHENAIPSPKRIARFAREARSAAGLHHTNIVPVFGFGEYKKTHYYAMQYIDGVTIEQVVKALRKTVTVSPRQMSTKSPKDKGDKSSAMSHASALQKGTYIKPRRIESESQVGSSMKIEPVASNTIVDQQNDMTVDDDHRENNAFDFSACDTFDLFQLTAEDSVPADQAKEAEEFESEVTQNLSNTLDLELLSTPYWKSVARIGFQIADALNYAHSNRVIHRDIKPANLLLDSKGTVWVTDFGLAKAIEEDNLTKTGDTVGTLRYMSPEQVSGKVDLRSDIYSLGLTLYELSTLRQAFEQQNQAQLFKCKTTGEIDSPRKLNRFMPRDLETIIIKATATNPAARYQTAAQMATDLQLFLEDRPIHSRRANAAERIWRWSRRNPVVAGLGILAATLLVITAVVSTVSNIRTSKALGEARAANEESARQKKKVVDSFEQIKIEKQNAEDNLELAEQNLVIAVDAFQKIQRNLINRGQPESIDIEIQNGSREIYTTQLTEADAKLLASMIEVYEKFSDINSENAELRQRKAEALHMSGIAYTRLQEFELADESLLKARKLYAELIEQNSNDVGLIATLARIYNDHAEMFSDASRFDLTMEVHLNAKLFLQKQLKKFPNSDRLKFELAYTHDLIGSLIIRSGMSELTFEQNEPVKPRPGFRKPGHVEFANRIKRELEKAARIFGQLADENYLDAKYLSALARTQRHQLAFALMTDDAEKADEYFKAAVATLEYLTTIHKENPSYIYEFADTLSMASTQLPSIEKPFHAKQQIRRALGLCATLTQKFPKVASYQLLTANCHRKMALVMTFEGEEKEAADEFDKANKILKKLIEKYPENASYKTHMTLARKQFAETILQIGRKEDSVRKIRYAKSLTLLAMREFDQFYPQKDSTFFKRVMSSLCSSLSKCHLELGEFEEAVRYERRAQLLSKLPWKRRSTIFERRFRSESFRK